MTKEELKEKKRQWYWANREKALENAKRNAKKRYENDKKTILERNKKWREAHKEEIKEYRDKNKEKTSSYNKSHHKKYQSTKFGRAKNLIRGYKSRDIKYNRGECTLTEQWIIDNIFTSKCRYCGKDDWTKLGCDRINNDLPHTPDNVVPCCKECNTKKGTTPYEEYIKMLGEKNS